MVKNIKILLLSLLVILILSCESVFAMYACSPSNDYINYQTSEEDLIEPIYCNEMLNKNIKYKASIFASTDEEGNVLAISANDSRYNAKEEGLVTSVKNQYSSGMCWAFSSISAIETNALKNGLRTFDLSEAHVGYSILGGLFNDSLGKSNKFDGDENDGGTIVYSPSYFFGGFGLLDDVNGETISFNQGDLPLISSSDYIRGDNFLSVSKYTIENTNSYSECSSSEINNIKNKIIESGSVLASIYASNSTSTYYMATTTTSSNPNHAVTIVGWDDTISKNNFGNKANRNGAWIVKNSWGTSFGENGYFYVSYSDNFICKNNGVYSGVSDKTFSHTYKSAPIIGNPSIYFDDDYYVATNFDAIPSDELIQRISFAVGDYTNYSLYIANKNDFNKNNWTLLKEGTTNSIGIDSYEFNKDTPDGEFMLVTSFKLKDKANYSYSSIFNLCDSNPTITESNFNFVPGKNFISDDGRTWEDLYNISLRTSTGSINLKCMNHFYVYTNKKSVSIVDNNFMSLSGNLLKVELANNYSLTRYDLINNLTFTGSINVYNSKNELVTNDNQVLETGSRIEVNENTYHVVNVGDTYPDGKISIYDYIVIRKHLLGMERINNPYILEAADAYPDGNISIYDYITIRKKLLNI